MTRAYDRRVLKELQRKDKILPKIAEETCSKCGYKASPKIHYCSGMDPSGTPYQFLCTPKTPPYEHLHITCQICGYTHIGNCKDVKE